MNKLREAVLVDLQEQLHFQVSLLKLCAPQERSIRPEIAEESRQLEELATLVPVRRTPSRLKSRVV